MAKTILASQIMTPNVVAANLQNKYSQVMEFFIAHKIQHLPVAFDDKLLGILSVNDMAAYLHKRVVANEAMDTASLDADFSIGDVMTRNPTVVTVDDTLETVISILAEGKFQAVPVTKDGLLHGIVTNKDLVRIYKWQLENN
jgi:acetoin utilization protein AcuB